MSEGLASRLDRADTVATDAHSELEVERARLEDESAQLHQHQRERETEQAQEALFEIRYQQLEHPARTA